MRDGLFAALQTCVSSAEHLGLALLLGVLLLRPTLTRGIRWCHDAERRLWWGAWIAWALLVVGGVMRLWFVSATLGHVPLSEARQSVVDLLSLTHYGRAWKASALGMLLVALALLLRRHDRWSLLLGLACAGYAYSLGQVSHAAEEGDFGWVMATAWLHILSTSAWAGLVLAAGYAGLPSEALGRTKDRRALGAFAAALSSAATVALALVVITGAIKTWVLFGTATDIFSTSSAQVLAIKSIPVLLAIALGAVNRFVVLPRIAEGAMPGSLRRFRLVLRVEGVLLVAALVAGVVLGLQPPP